MTVETTINLLQGINAEASGMVYAPELDDYPTAMDTDKLPIALTNLESGAFKGVNGDNQATDQYVIQVLTEALGQSDLGPKKVQSVGIFDAYRTKYLDTGNPDDSDDPGTYLFRGQPVIATAPYRITIDLSTFTTSGLNLVEWPAGSDRWWHGFEIRFTVKEEWLANCD